MPFITVTLKSRTSPLRAALLRGFRLVPAALTARVPALCPVALCGRLCRAQAAAQSAPRAGSALVNAAVKAAACFQLLNGDDIFRCHPNPKLIQLLLTSFQSLVWSPAAFRIFPLGCFRCPFTAHRGLTSSPDRCHLPAPISTAVTVRCQINCP